MHKNIHCDPSLEPSLQDGSNVESQHKFLLSNKKIFSDYQSSRLEGVLRLIQR